MMCMVNTILALEKANKKGTGGKVGGKKEMPRFFPKMMVVGNKKDLRKNAEIGLVDKEDIKELVVEGIRIKEVSALTNYGISDAFKVLVN